MPDTLTTNSPVIAAYRAATPGSAANALRAAELFPSGITHDSRYIEPYGLYITRAQGPRKWDVDGRCYVDYFGGHGALLLGHNHPKVLAAIHAALDRGTHFGACHELEVRWAQLVCQMVPSAECVRFTSSGTEATLMALRLARAYTGRSKLLRFRGHFHGWHDHMTSGHTTHFDGTATSGVIAIARRLKQWVMPCTNPRSDFGNQSCMARLAVGKAPASPRPKAKRTQKKEVAPDAQAVAAVIKDQNGTITRRTRLGPKKSASQPPGT